MSKICIHYEPKNNIIACGLVKQGVRYFTNDGDSVTCRRCKAAMKLKQEED